MSAPTPPYPRETVLSRAIGAVVTPCAIAAAWLIGLPRRWGRRLYAGNDAEARQWGWQVIERRGGLVRQYRDPRFDALRTDPTLRRDELHDWYRGGDDWYRDSGPQSPSAGCPSGGDA